MRRLMLATLLSLLTGLSSPSAAQVHPPDEYRTLLEQLRAGRVDIDYSALRFAFARTEEYNPFGSGSMELRQRMHRAFASKEFGAAIELADKILDGAYINGEAHLVAGVSHEQLGHDEQSNYHRAIVQGLLESICPGRAGTLATTHAV